MLPLSLLDFLNSREDAVLVWTAVVVACFALILLHADDGRAGLSSLIRSLLGAKLLALFVLAAGYTAVVVATARELDLWRVTALKETVYWFFGFGLALAGSATQVSPTDHDFYRKLAVKAFRMTIAIEFIVNVYVFPLAVELILVPLVGALVVGASLDLSPRARSFVDGVLTTMGLTLLFHFGVRAIRDPDTLLTRENAEDLLVVPLMTLAFVPFLYAVSWYSRWEQARLRKRLRATGPS